LKTPAAFSKTSKIFKLFNNIVLKQTYKYPRNYEVKSSLITLLQFAANPQMVVGCLLLQSWACYLLPPPIPREGMATGMPATATPSCCLLMQQVVQQQLTPPLPARLPLFWG
jgi:hypothetical protein